MRFPHGVRWSLVLVLALSGSAHAQNRRAPAAEAPACGDVVGFQVLLDRQGYSPGEIDGRAGGNLSQALAAFQESRQIEATGEPDCETWQALGGGADAAGTLTEYVLSATDVSGPFTRDIPSDLIRQASLPALGYRGPLERIGERFHASPALLEQLNPGVRLEAGARLRVPAVEPFDPDAEPPVPPDAGTITVEVSRTPSVLRATRADGTLAFFAPVTSGSEHDPLPPGAWKVTGVSWHPPFHYNPDLFWDAKPADGKATIKPGPNNPVGVVWIDLDIEHYGIHGTPEPGHVGHTESHGCVRLTNWDAARLASLVKAGSPVIFK